MAEPLPPLTLVIPGHGTMWDIETIMHDQAALTRREVVEWLEAQGLLIHDYEAFYGGNIPQHLPTCHAHVLLRQVKEDVDDR